jgi:hypothetical protein
MASSNPQQHLVRRAEMKSMAVPGDASRLMTQASILQSATSSALVKSKDKALNPPEQLESWKDSGRNVAGNLASSEVTRLANLLTTPGWCAQMKSLVGQGKERNTVDKGGVNAENYIVSQMRAMGLEVSLDKYKVMQLPVLAQDVDASGPSGSYLRSLTLSDDGSGRDAAPNIVGLIKGTDLSHETILVGAHYDSVNWENSRSGIAPGADDNGSGVTTLLSAAKVLSSYDVKPRRTVAFVAFSGEEEGLWGSKHFVKSHVQAGKLGNLKGAIIMDQVGYSGRKGKDHKCILETTLPKSDEVSSLVDTLAHSVKKEPSMKGFYVNWHGFGSDHIPFRDAGFPSTLLIESDDEYYADNYAHSARDTFSNVDCDFGSTMGRVALRTLLQYAYPKV